MQAAVIWHDAVWRGSDENLREALGRWEAIARDTGDGLARAYLGSTLIASARQVPNLQKRAILLRGARELNRAVAVEPANPQIRLLRFVAFSVLPRLAGLENECEEDLAWLIEAAEAGALADHCRYEIFYRAGAYHLRNRSEKALALLERAESAAPTIEEKERAVHLLRLARRQFGRDSRD